MAEELKLGRASEWPWESDHIVYTDGSICNCLSCVRQRGHVELRPDQLSEKMAKRFPNGFIIHYRKAA